MRHTFGTEMVKRVDVHTLQRLMGHAHITTTQKYLHYRPDPGLSALMDEVWEAGERGAVVPLRVA
jgi:site-specific recombinase XerD